ncbi:type II toxin-antitoxin system VapC family toxin [Nitrospira sp. M1]
MKFWDTSVLLPISLQEPQPTQVKNLIKQDDDIVVWWGTLVEGYSVFARLRREEVLTQNDEFQSRQILTRLAGAWTEVRPSNPVRDHAGRVLLLHPLRAADAL